VYDLLSTLALCATVIWVFERWNARKAVLPPDPVVEKPSTPEPQIPLPDDLERYAQRWTEPWAQESVREAAREAYGQLGSWGKVSSALIKG